jgi:hypothetical protein
MNIKIDEERTIAILINFIVLYNFNLILQTTIRGCTLLIVI